MLPRKPALGPSARGALALVATAFLWSSSGVFIKLIDWQPFAIAGARSLIAVAVIWAYLRRPRFTFSGPQVAAACLNAVTMLLFVVANKTTTAANAILLQYMAPIVTAFAGAWLLRERIRGEHWLAFAMVAGGMAALFMDQLGGGRLLGNLLSIASALTFGLFFVFMRMQKDESPMESMLLSHALTAAMGLGISLFLPAPVFSPASLLAIVLLGTLQIGLAGILFSLGIKKISALSASLIAVIEPVFNPLWVFLVVGEAPSASALAGGALIVGAVVLTTVAGARRLRAAAA